MTAAASAAPYLKLPQSREALELTSNAVAAALRVMLTAVAARPCSHQGEPPRALLWTRVAIGFRPLPPLRPQQPRLQQGRLVYPQWCCQVVAQGQISTQIQA